MQNKQSTRSPWARITCGLADYEHRSWNQTDCRPSRGGLFQHPPPPPPNSHPLPHTHKCHILYLVLLVSWTALLLTLKVTSVMKWTQRDLMSCVSHVIGQCRQFVILTWTPSSCWSVSVCQGLQLMLCHGWHQSLDAIFGVWLFIFN